MRRLAASWIAVLILASSPAGAATSATTDAFVALASRAYTLLIGADDLAANMQGNAHLRALAHRDRAQEQRAAQLLAQWGRAEEAADRAAARTPSLDRFGPIFYPFDAVVLPFDAQGRREAEVDRATLVQLSRARGEPFEAMFIATDRDALERLVDAYKDYIVNGDDPALRRLAVAELPATHALLAEFSAR